MDLSSIIVAAICLGGLIFGIVYEHGGKDKE